MPRKKKDPIAREFKLDDQVVIQAVDGTTFGLDFDGGIGITIGPDEVESWLDEERKKAKKRPRR